MRNLTPAQAIKAAKERFKDKHGKRAYNAHVAILSGNGNSRCVLIIANDNVIEYYF